MVWTETIHFPILVLVSVRSEDTETGEVEGGHRGRSFSRVFSPAATKTGLDGSRRDLCYRVSLPPSDRRGRNTSPTGVFW